MSRPNPSRALPTPDDIEAQFYEALRSGDIARLMSVWADDEEVVCVHPGGARLVGPAAIRASFEAVFESGVVPVQPLQVRRLHALGSAVHHLVERISVPGADGRQSAWVLTTNVYVKTACGWRMAAHHASPGSPDEPPPPAEACAVLH
jgi:uncharacterized protein (TIGR02246 family)